MRVFLQSIGCRLNQGEMDGLGRKLMAAGHEVVEDPNIADRFVLNTCAVTREAARDARRWARRQHRLRPDAQIYLTGCYATVAPDELEVIDGVTRVVPNTEKDALLALLDPEAPAEITGLEVLVGANVGRGQNQNGSEPEAETEAETEPEPNAEARQAQLPSSDMHGHALDVPHAMPPTRSQVRTRTRAFVKVQDGCDKRCTFCITTVARGVGMSLRQGDIIREIQALSGAGYAEVVLSGVHLGSYGCDLGRPEGLRELVAAVLDRTEIPRIRLSSLEPWNIAPGFFELWQNPRLLPHLHLPLQSGSDRILRKMARETDRDAYRAIVESARAAIPDLNITTDIICGFPGEGDEDFKQSLDFVREIGFGGLHVFSYSERPGTAAARMPHSVPVPLRRERTGQMIELGEAMSLRFHQRFEGRRMDVLWERGREVGSSNIVPIAELALAGQGAPDAPVVPQGRVQSGPASGAEAFQAAHRSRMRFGGYTPNYISVEVEIEPEDRVDLRGRVERVGLRSATALGMGATRPSLRSP